MEDRVLRIQLGRTNAEAGLSVSSLGDGKNEPVTLAGRNARRTLPGSAFIYVQVTEPMPALMDAWVVVDYLDQQGPLWLEYDAREGEPYRQAGRLEQQNTLQWKRAAFRLREPGFTKRQNGEADFRIGAGGNGSLVVSGISLHTTAPPEWDNTRDPLWQMQQRSPVRPSDGMTVIQQWQVHEPVPAGQLRDSAYSVARHLGITSLQSYVGWAQIEPEPGRIDFSMYDPVVDQIRKHGLKWLPFLITAPFVATPDWWRKQQGVDAVCLEHGLSTPIQSIWNPALRAGVTRFLQLFRDHYPAEIIEALNLGISGNWGESIMVAGGGFHMQGQHSHSGWWCGDPHAKAHFRQWLRTRYGSIDRLNRAWSTRYNGWDAVRPFLPAAASNSRAMADQALWYTRSMTDYVEHWVRTARQLYPTLPIYLCTGGDGAIELGADFGAQARMCAKYQAGIRITNQGDDAQMNFAITRMVSSSCRLYGGYYTTEPGGDNTPEGIPGRIFDATTGGSAGGYFKYLMQPPDQPGPNGIVFMDNIQYFRRFHPKLAVAALMPNTSLALDGSVIGSFLSRTADLRDALDFEFIDENMIDDGLLQKFRAVVITAGGTLERSRLTRLQQWVHQGGLLLIARECAPLRDVESGSVWPRPDTRQLGGYIRWPSPIRHIRVDVGDRDNDALGSGWHGPERDPQRLPGDATYRWTSQRAELTLPMPNTARPVIRVISTVPRTAAGNVRVLVNGRLAGKLPVGERTATELTVSRMPSESALAHITFESPVFTPGANDPRSLGIQVWSVQIAASSDALRSEPQERTAPVVDAARAVRSLARRTGRGWVLIWPGTWREARVVFAHALTASGLPWGRIDYSEDGRFDGVISSRLDGRVMRLNNTSKPVILPDGRTIPPWTIDER